MLIALIAVSVYATIVTALLVALFFCLPAGDLVLMIEGRRQALARLRQDAWWFSEDVPTMNVIARLADGQNVDTVRDQWRKERKAAKEVVTT